ncbi:MAG: hypothetical protein ABIH92_00800 [Nanoarchaeota archaeon]
MEPGYLIIVGLFLFYYLVLIISEKRFIKEPSEILEKFLAVVLLYAGVSLVYFSLTGKAFLSDNVESYNIYIFVIGFVAVIWTIPTLLSEFGFFRRFVRKGERRKRK